MTLNPGQPDPIERRLQSLGTTVTPDASIADNVLDQIESLPQPVSHHLKRWVLRISLGMAACILIGLIWFQTRNGGATVTYAQVIKALGEVKTMHAVGQFFYGDTKIAANEIWYERGMALKLVSTNKDGSSFTSWSDDKQMIQITDYGPKFGVHNVTTHPAEEDNETMLIKESTLDGLRERVTADPKGDREIDGVKCRLFMRIHSNGVIRTCYWLGPDNWVRRLEEQDLVNPQTNQWKTQFISEISYNIPIDPAMLAIDPQIIQNHNPSTQPTTKTP